MGDESEDDDVQVLPDRGGAALEAQPTTEKPLDLTGEAEEQELNSAHLSPANSSDKLESKHDDSLSTAGGLTRDAGTMRDDSNDDAKEGARKRKQDQEARRTPSAASPAQPHTPDDVLSQEETAEADNGPQAAHDLQDPQELVERKKQRAARRERRQERKVGTEVSPLPSTAPASASTPIAADFFTPNASRTISTPEGKGKRRKKAKKGGKEPQGQGSLFKLFKKAGKKVAKSLSPTKTRQMQGRKKGKANGQERSRSPAKAGQARSRSPRQADGSASRSRSHPSRSEGNHQ